MVLFSVLILNVFTTIYALENDVNVEDQSSRIWYGIRANITDAPYFASIKHCGAAIISDRWLVTAAHCVTLKFMKFKIKLAYIGGDSIETSKVYTIDDVIVHPKYSFVSQFDLPINDVALIHLSKSLKFSKKVQPITLPGRNYQVNAVHIFVGKGKDQTDKLTKYLMSMKVRALDAESCLSYLPVEEQRVVKPYLEQMKEVTICTKRVEDIPGLCHGDSGSPLVQNQTLVGIASYISHRNCSLAKLGMFTNVAVYVDWIESITLVRPNVH